MNTKDIGMMYPFYLGIAHLLGQLIKIDDTLSTSANNFLWASFKFDTTTFQSLENAWIGVSTKQSGTRRYALEVLSAIKPKSNESIYVIDFIKRVAIEGSKNGKAKSLFIETLALALGYPLKAATNLSNLEKTVDRKAACDRLRYIDPTARVPELPPEAGEVRVTGVWLNWNMSAEEEGLKAFYFAIRTVNSIFDEIRSIYPNVIFDLEAATIYVLCLVVGTAQRFDAQQGWGERSDRVARNVGKHIASTYHTDIQTVDRLFGAKFRSIYRSFTDLLEIKGADRSASSAAIELYMNVFGGKTVQKPLYQIIDRQLIGCVRQVRKDLRL